MYFFTNQKIQSKLAELKKNECTLTRSLVIFYKCLFD